MIKVSLLAVSSAAVAVVLGLAGPSLADSAPVRRPGLWSATRANGKQIHLCIDATTDTSMHALSMKSDPGSCGTPSFTQKSGTYRVRIECKNESGTAMTLTAELQGDFNTKYVINGNAHLSPPRLIKGAPVSDLSINVTMLHAGACPADMKPGYARIDGMLFDSALGQSVRSTHLDQIPEQALADEISGLARVTPPLPPTPAQLNLNVTEQAALDGQKERPLSPHALALRGRWFTAPGWQLSPYLDQHTQMNAGWSVGLEYLYRRAGFDVVVSVDYTGLPMDHGNYLASGHAAAMDTHYVHFDNLSVLSADVSLIGHWNLTRWMEFRLGGGLGIGVVFGDILTGQCITDSCIPMPPLAKYDSYPMNARVVPVLNTLLGLRFQLHRRLHLHLDGGWRMAGFYLGAGPEVRF